MALDHTSAQLFGGEILATFKRPAPPTRAGADYGDHRLAGITTIEGVPAKARVVIARRASGRKIADFVTSPDGAWEVLGVANAEYAVLVLDINRTMNLAGADMVRSVPMEP